jgi:hypothetical protein
MVKIVADKNSNRLQCIGVLMIIRIFVRRSNFLIVDSANHNELKISDTCNSKKYSQLDFLFMEYVFQTTLWNCFAIIRHMKQP